MYSGKKLKFRLDGSNICQKPQIPILSKLLFGESMFSDRESGIDTRIRMFCILDYFDSVS
jgi:hypothetical protein